MSTNVPSILLVIGPPASGKSSVCAYISNHFEGYVHIEVDVLKAQLGCARVVPWDEQARSQSNLAKCNAAALCKNYIQFGCNVLIDDVCLFKGFQSYLNYLGYEFIHLVILLPTSTALVERDQKRALSKQMSQRALEMREKMMASQFGFQHFFDSSALSIDKTAEDILAGWKRGIFRV
jgi:adenylate kinase family enzyme